jgi:hypothetical protein
LDHIVGPKIAIITKVSTQATYWGASGAIFGGFTDAQIIGYGGLIIGLIGLIVNCIFRYKSYKLLKDSDKKDKLTKL